MGEWIKMGDITEDDDLLDLGGLFDDGGADLLSLLDSVQKQQDGIE